MIFKRQKTKFHVGILRVTLSEEETHGSNQKVEVSSAQNCTVAYMSQCMAVNKCKLSCESMGAAKYRWFHEYGCCECIGSRCLGYGKKDALCRQCPLPEEDDNTDSEVSVPR